MQLHSGELESFQTHVSPAYIRQEDALLGRKSHFVGPVRFEHRHDVAHLGLQILTHEDLSIPDSDQIELSVELPTENRIVVQLEHAVNVVLQFDTHHYVVLFRV